MKLRRITQAALLGAVIAIPTTGSAQDEVVEARDGVIESTEAVAELPYGAIRPPLKAIKYTGGYVEGNNVGELVNEENLRHVGQDPRRSGGGNLFSFDARTLTPRQTTASNKLQQAINKLHEAKSGAEKATAKKLLEKALDHQFAADMKRRIVELETIKQRVAKMEAMLQKRSNSKDEIIGLRLQTLVNHAEGLGWSTGLSNHQSSPGGFSRYGGGFRSQLTPLYSPPVPAVPGVGKTEAWPRAGGRAVPASRTDPTVPPATSQDSFDFGSPRN